MEPEPASPAVAAAARRYRLPRGGRFAGAGGSRRGTGTGGAREFVDFRDYAPGDDLRHLDWRGLARSDQLRVRLFEEEVAPAGEVLIDGSASMAVTAGKAEAARALAQLFAAWIRAGGGRARCVPLGGGPMGRAALLPPPVPLRRRGVRVVLSDFLVPDDPAPLLLRLAEGAARLFVVQLLDPWEQAPRTEAATTLVDCETGQRLETRLDAAAIGEYQAALARLQEGLRGATLRAGGRFATVLAAGPETMCRRDLLPAGIVEPAA